MKKTHVEFVSGTKKTVTSQASVAGAVPEKKSKWDQKIPPTKGAPVPPKVPPGVQAAIKSNSKIL